VAVEAILSALRWQHAELDGLLDGLDDEDWERLTRCEGWSVADIVLHLAQTDELARATVERSWPDRLEVLARGEGGAGTVDDGAAAMVAQERGIPSARILERWREGARALRDALATSDPHRRVVWVAGELSTQTLATTRLAECWIHTGDIADALGITPKPTDHIEHIARLAWRTLPYAFTRAGRELSGPVAFDLLAPSGNRWHFASDEDAATLIQGDADELCLVAARRIDPAATSLRGKGPDAAAVLALVRTYA
jgi:uncharacterized protein (TIGR03084 family)